jgi:anti-sigma factor RsiW
MTDCPNGDLRDLLPDLLNGRLSPDVRQEVEAHVRACADCGAELALLGGLRASMVRGGARVPVVDTARISAAIPAYRAPARRSWVGWRTAAAIMAILAGGTSLVVVQRGLVGQPDTALAVANSTTVVPAATRDSGPATELAGEPSAAVVTARPGAARELALASSATSDLSDLELQALLKDIDSIDAVPSADVEISTPVSPVSPRGSIE